jgi:two-component system chemotaxis response regulator CheY
MIHLEQQLARDYLAECDERVAAIEADLVRIEAAGGLAEFETVERLFRALRWIRGGASLLDLTKIGELARGMEDRLGLIRSHKLVATKARTTVLLPATDRLRRLVQKPESSNQSYINEILGALSIHDLYRQAPPAQLDRTQNGAKHLRTLLAEDDVASQLLIQSFLSQHGECHVAMNGREAVQAFRNAMQHGERYDLICMDIMMPEMDGREAVRQIRALEVEFGILSTSGAKIVMTTAVDEVKEMIECFHELCDFYLTKPVDLAKLLEQMQAYRLVA